MKSIFVILNPPKTAVLTIWAAPNVEFLGIFDILKCQIPKNSKFKPSKIVKTTIFDPLVSAKIDVTYLKWQSTVKIPN